ncbi:hypothetical protein QUF70_19625 [Desulfobacterales bacterium HSG17]|nr:hypothetical protein [Desulfobacterales bacterium HSG17]
MYRTILLFIMLSLSTTEALCSLSNPIFGIGNTYNDYIGAAKVVKKQIVKELSEKLHRKTIFLQDVNASFYSEEGRAFDSKLVGKYLSNNMGYKEDHTLNLTPYRADFYCHLKCLWVTIAVAPLC